MNTEEALDFLRKHQPMPADDLLTNELMEKYDNVRHYFAQNSDIRCIPLFLNSFGEDGFGIYEMVKVALRKHPKNVVIAELKKSLCSQDGNVRRWCAFIASRYSSSELIEPLISCLQDKDDETRGWAVDALQFIPDSRVNKILQDAYKLETDNGVKKDIEEALKYRAENPNKVTS